MTHSHEVCPRDEEVLLQVERKFSAHNTYTVLHWALGHSLRQREESVKERKGRQARKSKNSARADDTNEEETLEERPATWPTDGLLYRRRALLRRLQLMTSSAALLMSILLFNRRVY